MPIREQTRLVLPTLALSGLLLVIGSAAAWYLHHAQIKATRSLAGNVTRVRATEELMLLGTQLQLSLDQFLLSGDREAVENAGSNREHISHWINRFDQLAQSDQDHDFVRQIRSSYRQFQGEFDSLARSRPDKNQLAESMSISRDRLQTLILDPARKYQQYNRDRLTRSTAQAQTLADRTGGVLLLLGVSGAIAGLMGGFASARRVQKRWRICRISMLRLRNSPSWSPRKAWPATARNLSLSPAAAPA